MASWLSALARTRDKIAGVLSKVLTLGRSALDDATVEELETALLQADVPLRVVTSIMAELRKATRGEDRKPVAVLRDVLVAQFAGETPFTWGGTEPQTILLVGINGSGKTTTAAKLAHLAKREGRRPLLGAADTFRAAGSDQLKIWADRLGVEVVGGNTGSDAASVAFDSVAAAQSRACDVLVVDTAGRMHTKQPLMVELQKVRRAIEKKLPGAPHETWIVLDASIGQNALNQARQFHEAVPLTGCVVTKLDGSYKAGVLLAIRQELKLPVRFVGLGEQAEDLVHFDSGAFIDALLGNPSTYKD